MALCLFLALYVYLIVVGRINARLMYQCVHVCMLHIVLCKCPISAHFNEALTAQVVSSQYADNYMLTPYTE